MGGKGQRRREKNYKAAHGGYSRLPPPPDSSSVDALPSKLRKLMAFTKSPHPGSAEVSVSTEKRKKGDGSSNVIDKKRHSDVECDPETAEIKVEGDDEELSAKYIVHGDDIEKGSALEKKKKKKKRKRVNDLRFPKDEELSGVGSRRRERKKQRLEAMKKKHKKVKPEEGQDFPGRELIKFGDIVEAPPKLVTVPKASKTAQLASQERLRLQAVEAYRSRKGWASRPGIHLPTPEITTPTL